MVSKALTCLIFFYSFISCTSCADNYENTADKLKKVNGMYKKYELSLGDIKTIDAKELYDHLKSYIIVDVREAKERKVSMLPGAITLEEFESKKSDYKERRIVFYCTIGYRSGLKVNSLIKEGFDAYNLKGSVLAWVLNGYPVYRDKKNIKEVHVYGENWNILPKDYKAIW